MNDAEKKDELSEMTRDVTTNYIKWKNEPTIKEGISFAEHYKREVINTFNKVDLDSIARVSLLLYETKERGNQIFLFGNGGSHSIASHIACDLGKSTKIPGIKEQKPYKTHSLDNPSWVTALTNDGEASFIEGKYSGTYQHGYDGAFVGQLENFLNKGDVAFGISSSGNSNNIVNALMYAKENGAHTVAMVGFDGGKAAKIADHVILVPTEKGKYGIVEGLHGDIHHLMVEFAINLEKSRYKKL